MKNILIALCSILSFSTVAHAEGFWCGTTDRELEIKVLSPALSLSGALARAEMKVSDPTQPLATQALATSEWAQAALLPQGTVYEANLTPATDSPTWLGAYPLQEIASIELAVRFQPNIPRVAGVIYEGLMMIRLKNGSVSRSAMTCVTWNQNS